MIFRVFLLFIALQCSLGFGLHARLATRNGVRVQMARQRSAPDSQTPTKPAYQVGEGLPDEISKNKCIYDMILVERYSTPERTSAGLFLPVVEGKDQKHLGKVLSVPTEYGLESEQGRVLPITQIAPYKVGDTVYIKDPWGIGPLNMEVGPRCFSFHKAEHITAVVSSSQ